MHILYFYIIACGLTLCYWHSNDVTPGDRLQRKFKKMSSCLCEFMNDCGLVSFTAMNIEDAEVFTLFVYTYCNPRSS